MIRIRFILIILLAIMTSLMSCNRPINNDNPVHNNDIKRVENINQSFIRKDSITLRKRNLDSVKTIKIVYVVSLNGVSYRVSPHLDSNIIGEFEFGAKLDVIEEINNIVQINDDGKTIKGKWLKVKARVDKDNLGFPNCFRYSGYVFDTYVEDSSKVDFTSTPIITELEPSLNHYTYERDSLFLGFKDISSSLFESYMLDYNSKVSYDTTIQQKFSAPFNLRTANYLYRFFCQNDYNRCYTYLGKIEPIDYYVLSMVWSGVEDILLIDSLNNSVYFIGSDFDYPCDIPVISKDDNKLIVYASGGWEKKSTISVYQKDENSGRFEFKINKQFDSNQWRIKEVVWIDDKSFAIAVYDDFDYVEGKEIYTNQQFFKVIIKEKD